MTQDPVLFYRIVNKTLMSPSGIEPATDVLCDNISVALSILLPTLVVVIAKTESCIREPKIRNQLLFHAFYLPDDKIRLIFVFESRSDRDKLIIPVKEYTPPVNAPYANGQQSEVQLKIQKRSEIPKILYCFVYTVPILV